MATKPRWRKYALVLCLVSSASRALAFSQLNSFGPRGLRPVTFPCQRNSAAHQTLAENFRISSFKRVSVGCYGRKESAFSKDEYAYSYDELSTDDIDDSASEDNPSQPQGTSAPYYVEASALVASGNSRLHQHFEHLRRRPFFRYFAVDLLSSCGYMPTVETPCTMEKCEITPADDVSPDLRKRDESEHSFQLDGWVRWDMPGDFTEYYDLIKEPERFTEYQGQRIWKFIHERICFQLRLEDFENAWKNDFNRFISGMHSAVSVHVVDGMPEDQRLAEYRRRLRDQKDAVQNLHFGYMLLLCAIHQATPRLTECGYMGDGAAILPAMKAICFDSLLSDPVVQRAASALRGHAQSRKAKIWKARLRTRDLLMIMNCVQCNLCRLHGKVTALGVATCLQVMIGHEGRGGGVAELHRIEVAALITVAAKFSHAIERIKHWEAQDLAAARP